MAETTQKPKTRKPRVPKTQPTPEEVIFSEVPETKEIPEVEELPKKAEVEELPEIKEEISKIEEIPAEILEKIEAEVPESPVEIPENSKEDLTEIPENSTEISTESLGNSTESLGDIAAAGKPSAHLYKLRPEVADKDSKWAVQIKTGDNKFHRIFVGSLVRARIRAFNYNVKHNLAKAEIKLISK